MPVVNRILANPGGPLGPGPLQVEGAWLEVEIAIPSALENYLKAAGKPIPNPVKGRALIDTGATFSAVDDSLIRGLGVNPINAGQGGTANGPAIQFIYPARFIFPMLGWTFEFSRTTGVNLGGSGFIALIGRDVLSRMTMVYNGGLGIVTFAI
ncbi:MAG: hypothetical protein ABSB29_01110 [Nitrososphaerales archaeon]